MWKAKYNKRSRYLFEKYLIINIDNIQRKYAIRSRYGINKNLTTGPDLQNIIKSDNDKDVTSHTLYSYQYFANKVRVDHIFFLSYTCFLIFLLFLPISINFSCELAIYVELSICTNCLRGNPQGDTEGYQRRFSLWISLFFLHLREKRKKQVAFLAVSVFSTIRMSLGISSFVILSSCYLIMIN